VFRWAAGYLSPANRPGKGSTRTLESSPPTGSFVLTRRVLKLARRPYYRRPRAPDFERELAKAYQASVLFDAHRGDLASATGPGPTGQPPPTGEALCTWNT
jgi:hypothetical protein